MRNIIFLAFLVLCLSVISCTGKHCLKVGGNYEGVNADLEYCFDAGSTSAIGSPVVVDNSGMKYIGISEKEVAEIMKEDTEVMDTKQPQPTGVQEKLVLFLKK